jgi:anaerobic magnesium-protoporphyrin IX monomethyl ester cyclase
MPETTKTSESFKTLLIFPPVWTPVTPYLALPLLVAYLLKKGLLAKQYDASLDFFLKYLLTPTTLFDLLEVIKKRERAGDYSGADKDGKSLIDDLKANRNEWTQRISRIESTLESMRSETGFYQPETCIRDQADLYGMLSLASLAYYPTSFTFNTFSNPAIEDFGGMIRFCDDKRTNPFLKSFATQLTGKLEKEQPSLVGISISTSHQLAGGLAMARFIKNKYPSIHVTLGGRHILRLQESFMKMPSFFPEFCHSMIMDNGERPLLKLILQLNTGGTLREVPNLVYFYEGHLMFNEKEPHEPIPKVPTPDFGDLPLKDYLAPSPIIPVRLSEGCYWGKCTFCSRYDNKKFQTVPAEIAVNQVEELQRKYNVSCFTVNDDCLTPTYLEAFSRGILKRGLQVNISLWCKPVGSFTRERLDLLSRAGVRLIRWGIETGHPRILKLMNKGTNLKDTLRVLRDASEAGIWNHATVILGFPTETEDEAQETINFLYQNRDIIHSSIFFRFVLLNHSYIMKNPGEFGLQSVSQDKNPFSYDYRFTCSKGVDTETLSRFLRRAQQYRIEEMYGHPFWFYLRIREYLLLYSAKYGLKKITEWKVNPADLSVNTPGNRIQYFFQKPDEIPSEVLEKIYDLVESGGEVGVSWVRENLKDAFLIGYAVLQGRIVGAMVHKKPLEKYVRQIEEKTHLDLKGYLERGYTYVKPEFRGLGVGDRLLKGLVSGSSGKKIYVTIRMDNLPPIQLTLRNNMKLAATYVNERTGHEIGIFTNH